MRKRTNYLLVIVPTIILGFSVSGNLILSKKRDLAEKALKEERLRNDSILATKQLMLLELDQSRQETEQYRYMYSKTDSLLNQARLSIFAQQKINGQLLTDNRQIPLLNDKLTASNHLKENYLGQLKSTINEKEQVLLENQELAKEIASKEKTLLNLESKANLSKKLLVNSILIYAFNKKGETLNFTEKSKHTSRVTVSFNVLENYFVEQGSKNIRVVFKAAQSATLDNNTLQNFTIEDKIDYQNKNIPIYLHYDKRAEAEFAKGVYSVEIFLDNTLTAVSELRLK